MHRHDPQGFARAVRRPLDLQIVRLRPLQETGQCRYGGLLVGQCLLEERVDPVLRLLAQAPDQQAAALVAGQDTLDQVIGAQEVGLAAQVVQDGQNSRMRVAVPKRWPEVFRRAPVGEREEILLRQAEQRRAERGGKGQRILGRFEEGQKRDDVPHREFGHDLQPVGARDWQGLLLAGADDLLEQLRPAADEDQEIPRMNGPRAVCACVAVLYRQGRPGVDGLADEAGDPLGEYDGVVPRPLAVQRLVPRPVLVVLGLVHDRPQVDPPRHLRLERAVLLVRAEAGGIGPVEGVVHHPQDRFCGPEAVFEHHRVQRRIGVHQPFAEVLAHPVELGRVGALEGVDRLLLVTNDKDRAPRLPRAFARREFARQPFDHVPLHGRGVLRLVDKDVVDAAVQPVEHPVRHTFV